MLHWWKAREATAEAQRREQYAAVHKQSASPEGKDSKLRHSEKGRECPAGVATCGGARPADRPAERRSQLRGTRSCGRRPTEGEWSVRAWLPAKLQRRTLNCEPLRIHGRGAPDPRDAAGSRASRNGAGNGRNRQGATNSFVIPRAASAGGDGRVELKSSV